MMAKIVQGSSFCGAIKYVMDREKAELLVAEGVRMQNWQSAAASFEVKASMNPRLKSKVCHISLNFSAQDSEKMTNAKMVQVALDYMKAMGIANTQYMIARHKDRDHPNCHIVYNRVDNDGKTISDSNMRLRNVAVCKELNQKHNIYVAQGKENVREHRLREPDKTKYEIYQASTQTL